MHGNSKLNTTFPGQLTVLAGYESVQLAGDAAGIFRQEACFLWLTGVDEPGWKVIIDGTKKRTTLVRPQLSEQQMIFDGNPHDAEILKISGADEIIQAKEFESRLRDLARSHTVVHSVYDKLNYGFVANPAQKELDNILRRIFTAVVSFHNEINALKAIKTSDEIKAIQKAINVTMYAFDVAKAELPNLKYEYELEAIFGFEFRRKNAEHAYEPIVASGINACTLHYTKNNARLNKNAPVLVDIGARHGMYCADITRTYIVEPTNRQQEVHTSLVRAQQHIIRLLRPGILVSEYMLESDRIVKETLVGLGLIRSIADEQGYREYMPHSVSHGLGIDVHDSLGNPRVFKEGMVLTVEPGIYIKDEKIGMRIEDDILITAKGYKNLSGKLSTDW